MTAETLDLWEAVSRPSTLACDFWGWTGSELRKGTYGDLFDAALRVATALRRRGIERGDTVAMVLTNSDGAMAGLMGAWLTGACVASLPIVARGMGIPTYVAQLRRLVIEVDAGVFLAEGRFLDLLPSEGLGVEAVAYESLLDCDTHAEPEPLGRDDVIFIQYSSGSTGEPKGVRLRLSAIEKQLQHLAEAMEIDNERDIGVTWLPMSHDMGLFGCMLLAWASGMPGLRAAPERFIRSPRTWLEDCAAIGATVTAAPPFALNVAAKAAAGGRLCGPLSIRTWLIGGDQINWGALTSAVDALSPLGVKLEAITVAYGLAEATLAVTLGDLEGAPRTLDADGRSLMAGSVEIALPGDPHALRLVSAGRPIRGARVRVESGGPGGSADMGEICVRAPSLAEGYHHNDEASAATFQAGELRTGDIGMIVDDELYIVGRSDDVVVVGGRNVRVYELEAQLATLPGVRSGNCALIDTRDGSGAVALLAEVDSEPDDLPALARTLRGSALALGGVPVRECLFVPKGHFPKTPSGKVQRFRCRALLAEDGVGVRVVPGRGDR